MTSSKVEICQKKKKPHPTEIFRIKSRTNKILLRNIQEWTNNVTNNDLIQAQRYHEFTLPKTIQKLQQRLCRKKNPCSSKIICSCASSKKIFRPAY